MLIRIQQDPFDLAQLLDGCGTGAVAVVTFSGLVRDDTGGAGTSDRRRRASVPTSTGPAPGANPEPQPGV